MKKKIAESINLFNRYRSPEATASLSRLADGVAEVEFSGEFCRTCGYHDYFEDLVIFLKDQGLNAKICKINEKDGGAVVSFYININ